MVIENISMSHKLIYSLTSWYLEMSIRHMLEVSYYVDCDLLWIVQYIYVCMYVCIWDVIHYSILCDRDMFVYWICICTCVHHMIDTIGEKGISTCKDWLTHMSDHLLFFLYRVTIRHNKFKVFDSLLGHYNLFFALTIYKK